MTCCFAVLTTCREEVDDVWLIAWPQTSSGLVFSQPCPMENADGKCRSKNLVAGVGAGLWCVISGTASRLCTSTGEWGAVNTTACTRRVFAAMSREVRSKLAIEEFY